LVGAKTISAEGWNRATAASLRSLKGHADATKQQTSMEISINGGYPQMGNLRKLWEIHGFIMGGLWKIHING